MTHEKPVHITTRPILPKEIIESSLSLESYLEQMILDNKQDEATRLRLARAREKRRVKYLKSILVFVAFFAILGR
jgi:hypothetical protein